MVINNAKSSNEEEVIKHVAIVSNTRSTHS